jgi:hypothetical protein
MPIYLAPVIVLSAALALSGRIVWLKANGRSVSLSLKAGRYAVWCAAGFSAALGFLQSGIFQ